MTFFERVKFWFDAGLWTASMVGNAVLKGRITEEEYTAITGEVYTV